MNLTKTQQDVVLRMADGASLCLMRHPERVMFYLDDTFDDVGPVTVRGLRSQGAIEPARDDWGITLDYGLTDAGREEAARIRENLDEERS